MLKYSVIISDCHLAAGRFFEGRHNPHEDFFYDGELIDLLRHFSSGTYGEDAQGPVEVELVINGDFFDPLNVSINGDFDDTITEEISLRKIEAILVGHEKVMQALRDFAALPGKRITYLVGNHDADLFFPRVRERIIRTWDPEGQFPSSKINLIIDRDYLTLEGSVEVRHGNQMVLGSALDFEKPIQYEYLEKPVLNLPWSSHYVLKIINRLKHERWHLDRVRPIKVLLLFGLILDPWFTLRLSFLNAFYFLKTSFDWNPMRRSRLQILRDLWKQETRIFMDLEPEARQFLDTNENTRTLILGHTHLPMSKVYADGKHYINTGTWTKTIWLDWQSIGQPVRRTFALVAYDTATQQATCDLRQWIGEHSPHVAF